MERKPDNLPLSKIFGRLYRRRPNHPESIAMACDFPIEANGNGHTPAVFRITKEISGIKRTLIYQPGEPLPTD